MNQPQEKGFLDELAEMRPDDQIVFLGTALGSIIRAAARDTLHARDVIDETIKVVEKSAGLRL